MTGNRRPAVSTLPLLRSAQGLTLLELLFALVIFGIVSGAIYSLLQAGVNSAGFNRQLLQSQVQVRSALDQMVDETRWAASVSAASATSVTLNVPEGTPFSVGGAYSVTFTTNAGTVTRRVGANPALPLAYNVVGFTLSYYDASSTALGASPPLASVAMIQFNVSTGGGAAGTGRTMVSNAALRAYQLP